MSTDTEAPAATDIPTGSWTVDPVHSVASFSVRHMMVGTFRGEFTDIEGTLTNGHLIGKVKVASLRIKNQKLEDHLFSPEFFDVERYPEIVFESTSLSVVDGVLTSEGVLSVKDERQPVTATGRIVGPAVALGNVVKLGLDLETTVDRNSVALGQWNPPLPEGGFALGRNVTISVSLELAQADEE